MTLAEVLRMVKALDLDGQRAVAQELSPLLNDPGTKGRGAIPAKTGSLMGMAGMFRASRHLTVEQMNQAIAEGARASAAL
jgi:hypothetical protein